MINERLDDLWHAMKFWDKNNGAKHLDCCVRVSYMKLNLKTNARESASNVHADTASDPLALCKLCYSVGSLWL